MASLLRPAKLNDRDEKACARGLEAASDGLFTLLFGAAAESILAAACAIPGHALSLEHATLAEDDGRVVGLLIGMPGTEAGDPDRILMRTAGWRALRAGAVALAARPLFVAMDRHDPGDWYLQAIAVEREARGRGIGTALLGAGFEQARTSGSDRFTLDVDVENGRARALYERFGLRVAATSKPARLLGGAAVHRMSVEL